MAKRKQQLPKAPEPVGGLMGFGIELKDLRPIFAKIRAALKGKLSLHPNVALTTKGEIKLSLRLQGETIVVELLEPQPVADINFIITIKSKILAVFLSDKEVEINATGLPNPRFPVVS